VRHSRGTRCSRLARIETFHHFLWLERIIHFFGCALNFKQYGSSLLISARARLARLCGDRMHSKSGTWPLVPPQRGLLFLIFLPHVSLAVTVTRGAEKHFALLFGAGNSYTVYIRPSKFPENPRIFFAPLFGSLHPRLGNEGNILMFFAKRTRV